jgi:hypothetical protein
VVATITRLAKAEFYIDGQLVYTDNNREGHYHLNGGHNLFDTTALSNGEHTLRWLFTTTKTR